jgi:protein-L-isoaspartate(D-aspartate) O-methyltransferase
MMAVAVACSAEDATESKGDPGQAAAVLLKADADDAGPPPAFSEAGRGDERRRMVERQIASRDVEDEATLEALRAVPRHELVPERYAGAAYDDRPLPIGHGQTISQPYIVGFMTELLELEAGDTVLEVGTGSGYQAAVLGQIVDRVVTIEIIDELARSAAADLQELGYTNVTVLSGDGYFGYEPEAPYDAIIVTAAAEHIPPPLIEQLKPGARMVVPVGRSGWTQNLMLVEKDEAGEVTTRNLMAVRFVPLTRSD